MEQNKDETDTRTEKIKKHFRDNRETYAIAAASFAAGIIASVVVCKSYKTLGKARVAENVLLGMSEMPGITEVAVQNLNGRKFVKVEG